MPDGKTTTLRPSPLLAEVSAYSPPKHGAPVDLHLDGNEGQPPAEQLLEAVSVAGVSALRAYPDASRLEETLARRIGVSRDRLLVTAGADDALERLLRASLAPGRELILPIPTFGMISRYARLTGGSVLPVPWNEGPLPVEAMIELVSERTSTIAVVSPNSPTGLVATPEDLERLSNAAPRALLIVDLAYTEFADLDLSEVALALPNAVITRTFSKARGLAGLRVGWAAGAAEAIAWMRVVGHPYAVSAPSLALALAAVESGDETMAAFVEEVRRERAELAGLLSELGASSLPSQGNFVLGHFAKAEWVRDGLAGLGVGVRLFPGKAELEGKLRITLPGRRAEYRRLARALRTVLRPSRLFLGAGAEEAFGGLGILRSTGLELAPFELDGGQESSAELSAWLLSSSPKEIERARSLGIMPLGCGDGRRERLVGAGAARKVTSVEEILEVLP